jgi:eukaryotic-like serine/threonine-protein kinase
VTQAPQRGEVLAGKYEVERTIGMGGMGVVVAARHLQLDERVALKFLLPEALEIPEAVARFAREARAAVKIKSDHVARVTDVGTLDNGAPYMVMEYLEGRDLTAEIASRGPLSFEEAADLILQACEAIAEAHSLGIIHRDIKPGNLFLAKRPDGGVRVKVLDFGISKMGFARDGAMTTTAAVMGSPLYMSPEQMEASRDVDARSDIWSLGVVLYEAVSKKVPFTAENLPQLCKKLEKEDPTPLSRHRPDVPPEFQTIIDRCLAKKRTDRYSNVGALATALAALAPRSSQASVGRITRVLANAGTLQDITDSLRATDEGSPPTESHVSIDIPENSGRAGSETRPGSPQAMSAEATDGLKTMTSGAAAEAPAEPPVQNVATAAPWSRTSPGSSNRAKLGIRIGAVVAGVAALVIYISTGRPTGTESAASSAPAANVEPPAPAPANPTSPAATPEGTSLPVQTAEAPAAAPSLPVASATPPAVSAVVPPTPATKPASSTMPRPVAKPPAPVAAKPAPSGKPAAAPERPAGLFDDRR